jgi:putative transposase
VDHEGEVLGVLATKRRDRRAALKFLKRTMKRYGQAKAIVPDRLRSYGAAIQNHFNQDRYLNRRDIFKQNRSAALAERRQLAA